MYNKYKIFGIYIPFFLLATGLTTLLRCLAVILDLNVISGYFEDKVIISISNYLLLCAIVFFLSYLVIGKSDMKFIPDFFTPKTYFPTALVWLGELFVIFYFVREWIKVNKAGSNIDKYGQSTAMTLIIISACIIFGILSLIHLVFNVLDERISSAKRANFGIFTVLFFAFYAIYLYFSTDLPINSPNKILDQMAYLSASVFFLYETRLSIGREKWREYISFGFIASALTAYSSIPTLLIYFIKGKCISNNIYETVLTLALFVYITMRILLTGELKADKENKVVSQIIQIAEKRSSEIIQDINDEVPYQSTAGEERQQDTTDEQQEETASDDYDDRQITFSDIIMEENKLLNQQAELDKEEEFEYGELGIQEGDTVEQPEPTVRKDTRENEDGEDFAETDDIEKSDTSNDGEEVERKESI